MARLRKEAAREQEEDDEDDEDDDKNTAENLHLWEGKIGKTWGTSKDACKQMANDLAGPKWEMRDEGRRGKEVGEHMERGVGHC